MRYLHFRGRKGLRRRLPKLARGAAAAYPCHARGYARGAFK